MSTGNRRPKKRETSRDEQRRRGESATTDPGVKIWDEDSQRLMESLSHDRKQATEEDYENLGRTGSGVTRGDAGND